MCAETQRELFKLFASINTVIKLILQASKLKAKYKNKIYITNTTETS